MAVGCGAHCAKLLLIILNIIFILSGLVLIAIGIWLVADPSVLKVVNFIVAGQSNLFRSAAILLITMGAFILLVSVIGFAGAVTEKPVVIGIYIALVALVCAGEFAGAIIAIVYKDKIMYKIDISLWDSLHSGSNSYYQVYQPNANSTVCKLASDNRAVWDYIQVKFGCCGVHDGDLSGYDTTNIVLNDTCTRMLDLPGSRPMTCCTPLSTVDKSDYEVDENDDQLAKRKDFDCSSIISNGCADDLIEWVEEYAPSLVGIGMGIGMLEMFVIIFAVCLCQHTKRYKEVDF